MLWKSILDHFLGPRNQSCKESPYQLIETSKDGLLRLRFESGDVWWPADATRKYIASEYWAVTDRGSPHRYERYGTTVEDGDVVLDCGACEGFFAQSALSRSKQLHLFEPVEIIARCLRRTFQDHLGTKVQVWEVALGSKVGTGALSVDKDDYQESSILPNQPREGEGLVQVTTIDEFAAQTRLGRVDYLKIDVEGADLDVLFGAKHLLARWLPKVAVATYHKPEHAREMLKLMKSVSCRYRVTFSGVGGGMWKECRPILAHFWVDPRLRKRILSGYEPEANRDPRASNATLGD
jgi:FkbM family methyltransferase